jgi:3-oxoacyl-[acyl-carrier-protein] synthase II
MKRRVVVTGLGVSSSLSCELEPFWHQLLEGKSGIHPITIIDTSGLKIGFGGDIPDFDPNGLVDPKEIKRLDRFTLLAMAAAERASRDSGIDWPAEDSFRCGVVVGSGIGGLAEIEQQMHRLFFKGPDRVSPFIIPKMMLNAASGNISIRYGLRGPNFAVATACASATNAMGDAFKLIRHDEADIVITGGSEAAITSMGLAGFTNMRALSDRTDNPQAASRPFDRDRDGFVLSEGAGIIIMEELEHARRRGARIYAEVLGFGASGDAGHITQPDPTGTGAARAMANAIHDAGLGTDMIDYVNAHGTSTPLGDKAETAAIKSVYGADAQRLVVSSTKSQLGHTLGASGGIEMVITVKAVYHDLVPPTINLDNPDPECDLDYCPHQPREMPVRAAMNNSFGFGGHNASIICGKLR